jgi:hypothetical protein
MSLKKYTIIIVLLAVSLFFTFAQEEEAADDGGGFDIDFNLGLGVETFQELNDVGDLEDVSYQKLSLSPDISIGKFGIGLDLVFHYQFDAGNLVLRTLDWQPEDTSAFLDWVELYLAKFKYIRWGQKNEPLFIKFGSIEDALLGNGFILGGYANTHFLPDYRIFGLSLDIDGALFDFPLVGLETFVGNVIKPDVIGFRPFFRPLLLLEIPIFSNLEIGATFAFDSDPFAHFPADEVDPFLTDNGIDNTEHNIFFWGIDFFQPILGSALVSLAAFGDMAWDKQGHMGGMLGAGGALFSFLNYGAQLRLLGEGFIPTYFDPYYDLARPYKYAILESSDPNPAFVGWFASLGTSILDGMLSLNFTLDGPFGALNEDTDNPYNYPHLTGSFTISEGLIPGLSFDATYDKLFIREFSQIFNFEGAVVSARINYQTGPAVISLFYQLKYDPAEGWSSDGNDVTSGLESLIKLN